MLYLISIGLYDEKDMSIRALETAKRCQKLYVEFYTNRTFATIDRLEKLIGRPVFELNRSDLEEKSDKIIEEAKKFDVGILISGDALSATTHISLLADAKKAGVAVKVVHGSSIFTAVAETGLSLYKFGATVTLPKTGPTKSFWEVVKKNKKAGLHTLILLEPGLSAADGLMLLRVKSPVVVACRLGDDAIIRYGQAQKLVKNKELKCEPAVIILPGRISFYEKEFLSQFKE